MRKVFVGNVFLFGRVEIVSAERSILYRGLLNLLVWYFLTKLFEKLKG